MRLQGLVTGSRPATPEWAMTWAGDLSPHQWVRHLFAALELGSDTMYGHIKKRKRRGEFLEFCRYLRSLHPPQVRIAIVCDNFGPAPVHQEGQAGRAVGRRKQRRDRLHAGRPQPVGTQDPRTVPGTEQTRIRPQLIRVFIVGGRSDCGRPHVSRAHVRRGRSPGGRC